MSELSCQQFELYASEVTVSAGREFETEEDMQAWVDSLRDTPLWEREYPQVLRVEVGFLDGRASGSVGRWFPSENAGRIEMHPTHHCELDVCHELAHVLASARYGSHAHDPWFADVYLRIVYVAMGPEAYSALHAAFERAGIDHDHDSFTQGGIPL
jgi:putative metallohydrolase (TIGR04338 family)